MARHGGSRRLAALGCAVLMAAGTATAVVAVPSAGAAPAAAFNCASIYAVQGSNSGGSRAVWSVSTADGTLTQFANFTGVSGTLNALGISKGGVAAFGVAASGTARTVYRYTPATNTTTGYPAPASTANTHGAVNPATGFYYYGGISGTTINIYGFNPNTNTALGLVASGTVPTAGANGDWAFDSQGNLYVIGGASDGTDSLFSIDQQIPTSGPAIAVTGHQIATIATGDPINGVAFGSDGYLYLSSAYNLFQADPSSGNLIAENPLSVGGQSVDMASCASPNTITVRKNFPQGRVNPTDQATLTVTGGSITSGNTGTTTGTDPGLQTGPGEQAGPVFGFSGTTYTVTESGPGTTPSSPTSFGYVPSWTCVDMISGQTLASGAGVTGQFVLPNGGAAGVSAVCTFTDVAQVTALTLHKVASAPTGNTAGSTITYTFTVTNTGTVPLDTVTVADPKVGPVSCPAGPLAVGASVTCTAAPYVITQADVNAGSVNNTATATGTAANLPNATGQDSTSTPILPTPGISVVKHAGTPSDVNGDGLVDAGDTIAYTFTVTNTGNVPLTGVVVNDPKVGPVSCPTTTLAPGATTTCTAPVYTITPADVTNGAVDNTATATGTPPSGPPITSPPSSTSTKTTAPVTGLTLTKSASPTTVTAAGQTVQYSFAVTNTGNVTLSSLAIADTFTAPAAPALTINCPATTLAPGTSTTCTASYTATQADVDKGSIGNTATASATAPGGATVTSNQSTATVTVPRTPKLTLVKTASPTTVTAAGQTVQYSFAVTNTGNVTVSSLAIADTFTAPAGPAPTINCPATTLAPGASTTCTASYTATQADIDNGSITNTATASATAPDGTTTTSAPSTASVTATQAGSLTLVKAADPTTITAAGQTVAYTFTVTNNGNVTITGVGVADTFTAPAGPTPAVNCPTTTLTPGQSVRCSATYTVTQADVDHGAVANQAVASGKTPGGGNVTSNPSAVTVPVQQQPALATVKTATPTTVSAVGQQVSYRIVVTNTGNVTVTGIALADTMAAPAGPNPAVSCPATTLAPGASTTCTASYTVTQADIDNGSVNNTATASGKTPDNQPVTSPPSTATVAATQTPALTLTKTATPTTVTAAGQSVQYSFAVRNTGNVTVTGLHIADTFDAPAGPALAINCPATTLAPGAATTCTASYAVTQADVDHGSIRNTAVANADSPIGPVASPPSQATVTATAAPALTVVKSALPATITAPGQTITYRFVVTNTGNVTMAGLTVNDTMAAPAGPNPAVSCPTTTLAPGASTTCTASYTSTQADVDNGGIDNTATVTGNPPSGPPVTSPPSTVSVPLVQSPSLALTKTADPGTVVAVGQTVTYRFTVRNTGNQTIHGLTVTDAFTSPAGDAAPAVTCPTTTLAPGAQTTCTATHTVTQVDLDNGQLANTATATATSPTGTTVTSPPASAVVSVTALPQLALVKQADISTITAAGQTVNYTFTVTNTGNLTVHALSVADAFAAPAGPGGPVNCPVTTLAPGASTVCTSSYTATLADVNNGGIDNTATTSALDPQGNAVPPATSSASVNAQALPLLRLVKSADPQTVTAAGQVVTYHFAVTNAGNVTIHALSVTDVFAAPAGPAGPVNCPVTTLAPGASTDCTLNYTTTQADLDNGVITNAATVNGADPGGTPTESNQSSASVTANPAPALTVTKTPDPTTISAAGQAVHYTFLVTNTGNVTLHDIAVSDRFDSPAISPGAPACVTTVLAPGASTTCTLAFTATQADVDKGRIVNTAIATGTDPHGDPAASDPARATVGVTQQPALTVHKSADPTTAQRAGETIHYAFLVTNTGNVTLTSVGVTDTFTAPAGPELTPACPTATLAPGAVMTCTASYTVTQADVDHGTIDNTASATGTAPDGGATTSPPSPAQVRLPAAPALSVVKVADPATVSALGQDIAYTVTVTNTGNVTIGALTVTDVVTAPAGESAPVVTCPTTTLAPGAVVTCTAHAAVTQADLDSGTIADTATATGTAPDGSPVPPASGEARVTAQQQPALALVKTADTTVVTAAGQHVTYRFQVTNTGNVTITGLAIADTLAAPAGPQLHPTCPVSTLAPTDVTTCTATYTVTQADVDHGTIDNSATAGGTAPSGHTTTSPVSTAAVTALPAPAMHLVKKATVTDVDHDGATGLGDTVSWTFTVTNTGNVTVHDLTVDDPTAGPVNCPTTTLAPGETITCTAAPHTVTQADVDHGSVDNTAVVTGTDPGGAPVASNPSSTHTPMNGRDGLTVVKTGALSGATISWTFQVTNTGTLTLHAVTVQDTKAGTVDCPGSTLTPGQAMTCHAARPYTPSAAEQAAGKVSNTATGTGVDPAGTVVTSPAATAVVILPVTTLASTGVTALPATLGWGVGLVVLGLLTLAAGALRRRPRQL